jgi:hypothetical protein
MKAKLVFLDWKKRNSLNNRLESIYDMQEGIELSTSDFHSGTTFNCEIKLGKENKKELTEAIKNGYIPCFYIGK